MENIKTAENTIRLVLSNYPHTRGDDKELILLVWREQGFVLTPEQEEAFKKSYSPETIRRTRQKIQEEGDYLPDENTQKARKRQEKEYRTYFSQELPSTARRVTSEGKSSLFDLI